MMLVLVMVVAAMMMTVLVRSVVAIATVERIGNIVNGASIGDRPWL